MKLLRTIFSVLPLVPVFLNCTNNEITRQQSFNADWEFHRGDLDDPFTPREKVQWREIDLPHDWSIEGLYPDKDGIEKQIFSKESDGKEATGNTFGGIGWYKKSFFIDDPEKRHFLYFEGVYMEAEIWVNGQKAKFYPNGYTSFFCELNPYLHIDGKKNTVAVKAKNVGINSRWYSGSGIYRHVWLISTNNLHFSNWGIFVKTDSITDNNAFITINAGVLNQTSNTANSVIKIKIIDDSGKTVHLKDGALTLNSGEEQSFTQNIKIADPLLWSVDSPKLYTAVLTLKSGKKTVDETTTTFGIRTIKFSAEKDFQLNGQSLKLVGGCIHHDNGLLGAVAIDRAEEKKVELLKQNGYNAVRCAHNPPSEKFLDYCDKYGLLVINEAFDQWEKPKRPNDYHRYFAQYHEQDIRSEVLRDRNHPSIIMWSIGNEIPERADSSGMEIASKLKSLVLKYDPTRPVTAGVCTFWDNPGLQWEDSERAFHSLDVAGYNYVWWEYENDHQKFPDRIIYGSETVAKDRSRNWEITEKHPYVIGEFLWTAIDYLGESGLAHAIRLKKGEMDTTNLRPCPWFNAWCGDIDICGNKKPQTLYRDVVWGKSTIEMAVQNPVATSYTEKVSYWGWPDEYPTWNWKGHEGKNIDIRVYSRYPSVRLYLNGWFIEEKQTLETNPWKHSADFSVKYIPGELKAVGIEDGSKQDSVVLITTEPATGIRLQADRSDITSSRNDLSYISIELVDKNGNLVCDEDQKIQIELSGPAEIAASGNASPKDMKSFRSTNPKTYRGRALAIVRPVGEQGNALLTIKSLENPDGVKPESIAIKIK